MATSGTVSTTRFTTRKIIDTACRRCRLTPQQITTDIIDSANDELYLYLSSLLNYSIPLWLITKEILPLYTGVYSVPLPLGTIQALDANLRTLQRVTGSAVSSSGLAQNAFDGDLTTATVQDSPDGWIQLQIGENIQVSTFGILANATGAWGVTIQGSNTGGSFTDIYTTEFNAVEGEWLWIDVQGVAPWTYFRLKADSSTTLNVTEFFLGTMPQEITLGLVNRSDYDSMPNKFFLGRPSQYWMDVQKDRSIMQLWPAPQEQYTFAQVIAYTYRYIQDVGTMTQELEVPQRWYDSVVANLAYRIASSHNEVDISLVPVLQQNAMNTERLALMGDSDRAPSRLTPNISVYTR